MFCKTVVHEAPVWKDRANFIIAARINEDRREHEWKWEQLWARKVTSSDFEICCIPFFVYDLSLGDYVTTEVDEDREYVVKEVVRRSGRVTFRAWLSDQKTGSELAEVLQDLGCLLERKWARSRLFAIDTGTEALAREIADLLYAKQQSGLLVYENGRLS